MPVPSVCTNFTPRSSAGRRFADGVPSTTSTSPASPGSNVPSGGSWTTSSSGNRDAKLAVSSA